ncbi:MAG: GNAT family N-acetyltransferase [Oscillospiraceae bacterium]|jgi:PhnO protein|nr:GNAT family N-acetyltransferase [Oscillospiraceae bacterium]
MDIRPATPLDAEPVYALICALEDKALPQTDFRAVFARNLADPDVRYLVAQTGEDVLGFISLHMGWQLHHAAKIGQLQELIVRQDARSRGIGEALLAAATAAAKAAGCAHMELNSGFARPRAHIFYERHGWAKDHYNFTYKHWGDEM